jgi:hypothetical protein
MCIRLSDWSSSRRKAPKEEEEGFRQARKTESVYRLARGKQAAAADCGSTRERAYSSGIISHNACNSSGASFRNGKVFSMNQNLLSKQKWRGRRCFAATSITEKFGRLHNFVIALVAAPSAMA